MILRSLDALYDRLDGAPDYMLAPPGYSLQKITFKVVLKPQGNFLEFQDARVPTNGSMRPKQLLVPGGAKSSGSGLNPGFLWDNTGYMLGYKVDDTNLQRTTKAFCAFRDRHLKVESEIKSSAFSACCRFLENWDPGCAGDYPVLADAGRTGFGVFHIQGETKDVHDDPVIERWWTAEQEAATDESRGQCLVTGIEAPLARLHRKIKGVVGAQTSGATIVGFNEAAYESYGKKQSFNAPVSKHVAFRYITALNALLAGPLSKKHRFTLGDTTVAFWTDGPTPTEDIFARFVTRGSAIANLREPQDEGLRLKLEAFLNALRRGREAYGELEDDSERTPYFLLGLAPTAARISVRFFNRGTLANLLDNLRRHHNDIAIARRPASGKWRGDPEFPAVQWLLDQTCPSKNGKPDRKKIPPILAAPLLRAIITGSRYPDGLCAAVVRRLHADPTVNYLRACVIKGYLNRNLAMEVSMSLDVSRTDPAYRLGRLFACLEKTQKDALGEKLNKTIRDSFYSSASATPGSVFPRLLRTYQHHLGKLEGGHRVNREKLVQEIFEPLEAFPSHLDLTAQGLFAIGYYHQTRDFYTKHEDADDS